MIISNKTQSLDFDKDMNSILCDIDTKLSKLALHKLNALRYGAKISINELDYKLLGMYRKILLDKANNSCCLRGFLIEDIVSRIKQLLNRN